MDADNDAGRTDKKGLADGPDRPDDAAHADALGAVASQIVLVTGASSGFGRLSANAVARGGLAVYGAMRETAGRNTPPRTGDDDGPSAAVSPRSIDALPA